MLFAWFSNSDWLDDKKTTLFLTVAVASGRYGRHVEASANLASCTRTRARTLTRVEREEKIKGLKYATLCRLNRDHSATLDPRP